MSKNPVYTTHRPHEYTLCLSCANWQIEYPYDADFGEVTGFIIAEHDKVCPKTVVNTERARMLWGLDSTD